MSTLTSTTAPGQMFASRGELAEHYKSDWHKYNLKRREANMAMLTNDEFSARLEAAMALRREREGRAVRSGRDHLKDKSAAKEKKKEKKSGGGERISKRQLRAQERIAVGGGAPVTDDPVEEKEVEDMDEDTEIEDEEPPEINPKQSLFDNFISIDVKSNIEYMYTKYGFFVPDKEFLVDQEGLIGYCAEKIKIGHTCLYCQRMFRTWRGCQEHMINSRHAKLKYEAGIDLEEFDVFYDFSADNEEFLKSGIGNHKRTGKNKICEEADEAMEIVEEDETDADGDDEDWKDVDSDEEMEEDGIYAAYEDEIARHGFDVTPLGELIFPDGRIIGHRGLSRYYKQRFIAEDDRPAVVAARKAQGERVYNGVVYDTHAWSTEEGEDGAQKNSTALQLAKAGLAAGAARGRSGKGILVPNSGRFNGTASYTALSLYRYKAAVKKSRKEEKQGQRLEQRWLLPMNKMDKKANRLFNNVSVQHAPR
jgi:pre-60S factor REI1